MGFFRRKKKVARPVDEKQLNETVQRELNKYLKQEDVQEYLEKIKGDERRRKTWESLSRGKKLKLLRYLSEKRGINHGKR